MTNDNLQTKIKKSQWVELIGEILYIVSSVIYIIDSAITSGTILYLVASIFFLLAAIFMFAHSLYLINRIQTKSLKSNQELKTDNHSNNV